MKQEIVLGAALVVVFAGIGYFTLLPGQSSGTADFTPLERFNDSMYFQSTFSYVGTQTYFPPYTSGEHTVDGFRGMKEITGYYIPPGNTSGSVQFRIYSFRTEDAAERSVTTARDSLQSYGTYTEVEGQQIGSRTLYLVDRNEAPIPDMWRIKFAKGPYQYAITCQFYNADIGCGDVAQKFSGY